jgi:uncharacterized membrane protein YphA (DoxX/SURF4 family)
LTDKDMNGYTRIFLVLLRLAIGWHFFFEGLEKIHSVDWVGTTITNRPWSSLGYLREATGPAAAFFRKQAGDPDAEALAIFAVQDVGPGQDSTRVPQRQRISPVLDKAWEEYLQRFTQYYHLTDQQATLARARMDQAKDQAVRLMLGGGETRSQEKAFQGSAVVSVKLTFLDRLTEYRAKERQMREALEEKLPAFGRDVERQNLVSLKAEVSRLRTELLAELERPMQEALDTVLTPEQRKTGPIPVPKRLPMSEWKRMDWIDAVTRYGLTAVGACLLLGLFTRTACLGGAAFLLLFYLAMPALPWVPENPRAEGHYLFINKNIIEMLALLTLATTRSGTWVGLDGLIRLLAPWRWRGGSAAQPE